MESLRAEISDLATLKDLKSLLSHPGPCVSVYMPLAPKTNARTWQNLVSQIEPELASSLTWENVSQGREFKGKSIAVFRSPQVFHVTALPEPAASQVVTGSQFYIRPLLGELAKSKSFYILALSQKDVRLLHCTYESCDEVALPRETAASFDAYMNTAKPDHNDTHDSSAGPSSGHSKGVLASTSTTREDKPEYLAHFFKQIDRAVHEVLRDSSEPLVLAAVDYEIAQYRTLNTYPHLCEAEVHGAANSLKSGEMHTRAIEALEKAGQKKADELLVEYNHKVGGGASNRIKDVVKAAHEGRVLTLMVSNTLEQTGTFDEATQAAKGHSNGSADEEDLINDAAVQTILHGGKVLSLSNKQMPNGAAAAAIFRY